jgi:uncharacterized repeat protein (TIGR01451 family)
VTLGAIANGADATLAIVASVNLPGELTNTASVATADQNDPNPANNSSGVTENGQASDIQLLKGVDNANPLRGDDVTFTITATNNGPSAATGVVISDVLPAGLLFVSATPSQGTYNNASGVWTVGVLAATGPAATVTLTIVATVDTDSGFTNTVTLTGLDQTDPNPANNSASVPVAPIGSADLSITKTDGRSTYIAGDAISYTIVASNAGPSDVTGASVIDTLPAAFSGATWTATYVNGASGPPGGVGDINVLVDLPSGASATFTLTGSVAAGTTGNLANTATIAAPAGAIDPNPTNDSATDTDAEPPAANPDSATTPQNTPVTTNVLDNDTVPPGGAPLDPASVTITIPPAHGTVTCDAAGACTYTPDPNYSGPDSYTYQVCDTSAPTPTCVTALVTLTVQPNVVTANPDTATTPQNTPVTTDVLGNDTVLPNGAPLDPASVMITTPPANGTVTCDATGTCTYTPNPGYSGPDTYTYQVCDTSTPTPACATASVTVTVGANTPVANPDDTTTPYATPVTTPVIANDSVPPGGAPLNPASVTPLAQPANGTVTCAPSGDCTYTPNAGFSGTDAYTYQVCDTSTPTPACATATVTVVVGPNAVNDTNTTPQNTPVSGNAASNDQYPSGSTFTLTAPASSGTVTLNPDGSYTYTPAPGFSGVATFGYTVCEAAPNDTLCSSATVTITVGANNVVANPDTATTAQNTPVSTNVVTNDSSSGAPLNPASVTIVTLPTHGTVICNNPTAGTCIYTPDVNYSGPDSYVYSVCDTSIPTPLCAQTSVDVTVQPNVVMANPDTQNTAQNTPVTTNVLGNDTVPPNGAPIDPASVTPTQPAHGTVVCDTTGECTYTPNPGYSGPDSYTYQVCDTSVPTPVCSSTTVQVTVGANTVAANPDVDVTPYATAVTTDVIGNDTTTGAPLNPASVVVTTAPANGSASCDTSGACTYTPNAGFSGQDVYTYQVCDTSTPTPVCAQTTVTIQVGPNAVDDIETTAQNTAVNGNAATNDAYPTGSVFTQTSNPQNGTVTFNPDGTYTYTPAPNFTGVDTFDYQVCEPAPNDTLCATATVTITVNPGTVAANPDTTTTPYATPVTTNVIANDTSTGAPLDPASVTITTDPTHGTVTCDATGACTYTPDVGFSGSDTYVYQVCDQSTPTPVCAQATVTVVVGPNALDDSTTTAQNTPVNGSAATNDIYPAGSTFESTTLPAHGTVTMNPDGSYTYTPDPGFSGTDSFDYQVCEAAPNETLCATATVTITIGANTPVANPDTATTPQNTPVTTNVVSNDTVPPGGAPLDPASVTITIVPAHGTVTCDAAGACTYTPDPNYSGPDSYTYQVCDTSTPTPTCVTALVTLTVQPNVVTANPDTATTSPDTPVVINVLGNDTVLPNGAPLDPASVTITVPPAHGTVTCDSNGNCTYTPNPGFSGTDTYTYQVCDVSVPTPVCSTATVTIITNGAAASADLNVQKTGPVNVTPGTNVSYVLSVTNAGPDTAVAATLDDPTPAGLTLISASTPCQGGFPCALGDLAAGANVTVTVTFAVPTTALGTIVNTATVTSPTPDPNPADNSSTVQTTIVPLQPGTADLVVVKSGPASASAGSAIAYTIVVSNNGPADVPDAVLTDPTPNGLNFVSATAPCNSGFPCTLGALANGASVTITVNYTVQSDFSGSVVNTAGATSLTVPDLTPNNNTSTRTTTVGGGGEPTPVTPVPIDARWMLALMSLLLMLLAGLGLSRRER